MKVIYIFILSLILTNNLGSNYPTKKDIYVSPLLKLRLIIRYKESTNNYAAKGKLGEIGAYQFMPYMYDNLCRIYFGKVLIPTKENQDELARKYIADLHRQGYTIYQIASIWNCGKPIPNNNQTKKYVEHIKHLYHANNIKQLLEPYNQGGSIRNSSRKYKI